MIQSEWYKANDTKWMIQKWMIQSEWYKVNDTKWMIQNEWYKVNDTKFNDTKRMIQSEWYKVLNYNSVLHNETISKEQQWSQSKVHIWSRLSVVKRFITSHQIPDIIAHHWSIPASLISLFHDFYVLVKAFTMLLTDITHIVTEEIQMWVKEM